ncbi:3-oxo-5-alpha-steroid 4-dehydrogenase 2 [Channa argus]|uniref:3-oxo-5alpha-steroid 4-dehydrogenase (NADP(+)) n=1 Tax=Channa argus TaxID=215402 RepID=A0A6G1PDK0_CHAAH|nr:3-oxo-5-alpha-steroid 4-dehydrogenase 2 [Channa argus]
MECQEGAVSCLSWALIVGGAAFLWYQTRSRSAAQYGRYTPAGRRCCSARLGWFLQEVPAFALPLLLLLFTEKRKGSSGKMLLLSFIYAFLTRGQPVPLDTVVCAVIFCSLNGFLQGHHLLHCAQFEDTWLKDARLAAGLLLFVVGMSINTHSDYILRNLRKPEEIVYRIPYGGMFEFVSGANFFGEIVEWCGYAVAVWSLPAFAFAFFTICSIGPRAYQHHRDYLKRFKNYPQSRKAVLPFLL